MIGVVPGVVPEVIPKTEKVNPGNTVIRTKLEIPKVQPMWVVRPRLNQRLDMGLQRPITLLSAPAGFGKTALLTEWCTAHMDEVPVAWFSLDERDNHPVRFAAHLRAALNSAGLSVESGEFPTELTEEDLAALVNQIHEFTQDFVLVLDDYHLVSDSKIHKALEFLLDYAPNNMHLILSSRVDPPLPLAQMRARGQLTELRAPELRFTHQEVGTFLNQKLALNLQPEVITAMQVQSEGWIAGLYLAALSIRDEGRSSQAITGSHHYIVDYLVEQVFDHLSPIVQKFLLDTSVMERLSDDLCNWLTGLENSQQFLELLESENLFLIPLDSSRRWYRYHPLFGGFLRERLRRMHSERWLDLHRRAIEWCERNGHLSEAIDHALIAGDFEKTLSLLDQIAEVVWQDGQIPRLQAWLKALPEEEIQSRPRLCLYYAWISANQGDKDLAADLLHQAEKALDEKSKEQAPELQGMILTVRSNLSLMENNPQLASQQSSQALACLSEEYFAWRTLAAANLGLAFLYIGKTRQAIRSLQQAVEIGKRSGNLYIRLWTTYAQTERHLLCGRLSAVEKLCQEVFQMMGERERDYPILFSLYHLALSEALRAKNELVAGLEHAQLGLEYARLGKHHFLTFAACTQIGLIFQASGKSHHAERAFQQAHEQETSGLQICFWLPKRLQVRLWTQRWDPFTVEYWLQENSSQFEDRALVLADPGNLFLSRSFMEHRHWDQAQRLLSTLQNEARRARLVGLLIEILVPRALAFWAEKKHGCAFRAINQAIHLAEQEANLRVFLDEGSLMQTLIAEFHRELTTKPRFNHHGRMRFVENVLQSFQTNERQMEDEGFTNVHIAQSNPGNGNGNDSLVDPLSEREIEVLSLIAEGMPNRRIAQQLVLAPSTVHWHTKNIYSKLNVHSRTQAVYRARELAVLP
jgi:LuxR family maltose regulon positive regulatory protein